jgi:hypothetical protein
MILGHKDINLLPSGLLPSAPEFYRIWAEASALAGSTAGQELHLSPKINLN